MPCVSLLLTCSEPVPLSSVQTTTARPIPTPGWYRASGVIPCCSRAGAPRLFFQPARHGVARDTKGAAQTAQAGAFLIGAQNQLALFFGVAVRTRIGGRAPPAVAAQVTLAAVGGRAVAHDRCALTMRTGNQQSDHPDEKHQSSKSPMLGPLPDKELPQA